MKATISTLLILISGVTLFVALRSPDFSMAQTETGGPFDLSWHTIDGGGNESSGGSYGLTGTIGQPDVGSLMSGGSYTLVGGFWGIGGNMEFGGDRQKIYLPLLFKN